MFNINGLPHWTNEEISYREVIVHRMKRYIEAILLDINSAWHMIRIETPLLMPESMINMSYSKDDFYSMGGGLALRPETTTGSYEFIKELFKGQPKKWQKPPICVWQSGKSFRKEQDQPSKYCRFKEFYQLEFQCIYSKDSKCDYHTKIVERLSLLPGVRVIPSDRLPSYSDITMDLEMMYKGRWMEIASISRRTDFDDHHTVIEIAFGLDRLVMVELENGKE